MIYNEWIKVEKNLITEIKGVTPEGIPYFLPIGQFPAGFIADDYNKNVRIHPKNGLKPAQDTKGRKPSYNNESVYTVTIANGKQYYADRNGKPILINGEPFWCFVRDNATAAMPRNQWLATNKGVNPTSAALENYIEKRISEKGLKTKTGGGHRHGTVVKVFRNIYYETVNVDTNKGVVRQVFKDNPFSLQDLKENPDLLNNLYITYGVDDEESVEEAINIEIDMVEESLKICSVDKTSIEPYNPRSNIVKKINPSPELIQFIDEFIQENNQYIEMLDDKKRKRFDNKVEDLKQLNHILFAKGYYKIYRKTKNDSNIDTDKEKESKFELVQDSKNSLENAKNYIEKELINIIVEKEKPQKIENTLEENEEIKGFISKLLKSDYREIIIEKYNLDNLDDIVDDAINGGNNVFNEGDRGEIELRNIINSWMRIKAGNFKKGGIKRTAGIKLQIRRQIYKIIDSLYPGACGKIISIIKNLDDEIYFKGIGDMELNRWGHDIELLKLFKNIRGRNDQKGNNELENAIIKKVFAEKNKINNTPNIPNVPQPKNNLDNTGSPTLNDILHELGVNMEKLSEDEQEEILQIGDTLGGNFGVPIKDPKQVDDIKNKIKTLLSVNECMREYYRNEGLEIF